MKASKVLLVGFSSLNAEIAKNLVLAGVQSIVILENEKVIQEDFGSHLFISPEHFGKNVNYNSGLFVELIFFFLIQREELHLWKDFKF